jgi:hypothetical protein
MIEDAEAFSYSVDPGKKGDFCSALFLDKKLIL